MISHSGPLSSMGVILEVSFGRGHRFTTVNWEHAVKRIDHQEDIMDSLYSVEDNINISLSPAQFTAVMVAVYITL